MKELYDILMKDIQKENFTRRELVVYGVIAPAVFIAFCILAGA